MVSIRWIALFSNIAGAKKSGLLIGFKNNLTPPSHWRNEKVPTNVFV